MIIFIFISSLGSAGSGGFFPYLVYLSSNALFPLMALFVWLKPAEYYNFLSLLIAGKIIGVVSFYAWQFFSTREILGFENLVINALVLWGSVIISLADILSLWGAWTLKNILRREFGREAESGGL